MEIEIKQGKVVLRKPTAGMRNKAIMKAETAEGIKNTVMLYELLPSCVLDHPFGQTPIKEALDSLEIEDYDKLVEGLSKLLQGDDVAKKQE